MKKFPVPVPPPEEQGALVALMVERLDRVSRLNDNIKRLVSKNARLKGLLLASAFAGTLVDQDPADEPASALLERIAVERASEKPAVRRRTSSKTEVKV